MNILAFNYPCTCTYQTISIIIFVGGNILSGGSCGQLFLPDFQLFDWRVTILEGQVKLLKFYVPMIKKQNQDQALMIENPMVIFIM